LSVSGGPAWIDSDRYTIDAKAEGSSNPGNDDGADASGLLEDRFKLKHHREIRQVPIYVLTAAKGGIKLHRTEEGDRA
jgi:uncharacterized protein (TIGR03435 family)